MSMTREEAIKWLEEIVQDTDTYWESCSKALQKELDEQKQVFLLALSALRPITREQVEKMRGEWVDRRALSDAPVECSNCGEWVYGKLQDANFCPFCGVPMTDEAVDMVMERMEALYDTSN